MNVVLFSGTTEGRRLSRALAELGAGVTVCVATQYGREEQGEAVSALLAGAGFCRVTVKSDLSGLDRVVWGQRSSG